MLAQLGLVLLLAASAITPAASPVPSKAPELSSYESPAYYQNLGGSDQLKLKEIARIVEKADRGPMMTEGPRAVADVRRITIVATIVEARRSADFMKPGDLVVIDYTVDYAERAKALEAAKSSPLPAMPRGLMYEPDPPTLDDKGEFWAHLAKAGTRLGNVNRYSGRRVNFDTSGLKGPVFVPIAGTYSFVAPVAKAE